MEREICCDRAIRVTVPLHGGLWPCGIALIDFNKSHHQDFTADILTFCIMPSIVKGVMNKKETV